MSIQSYVRKPVVAALLGATVAMVPAAALLASRSASSEDARQGTAVSGTVAVPAAAPLKSTARCAIDLSPGTRTTPRKGARAGITLRALAATLTAFLRRAGV